MAAEHPQGRAVLGYHNGPFWKAHLCTLASLALGRCGSRRGSRKCVCWKSVSCLACGRQLVLCAVPGFEVTAAAFSLCRSPWPCFSECWPVSHPLCPDRNSLSLLPRGFLVFFLSFPSIPPVCVFLPLETVPGSEVPFGCRVVSSYAALFLLAQLLPASQPVQSCT